MGVPHAFLPGSHNATSLDQRSDRAWMGNQDTHDDFQWQSRRQREEVGEGEAEEAGRTPSPRGLQDASPAALPH